MVDAILAVWLIVEAIRRECRRLIPVGVLVLLYEATDVGWIRLSEIISMEGSIKKLILLILAVFLVFAWRKGEVKISALVTGFLALASRLLWSPVFDRYLDAVQKPDANYLVLIVQGLTTKVIFNAVTGVMLFLMLALLLRGLLKLPVAEKKPAC